MLLHCGGVFASYEQVGAVETPEPTDSYAPIAHTQVVRLLRDRMKKECGLVAQEEKFGLTKQGQEFFYEARYDWKKSERAVEQIEEKDCDPELFDKYRFFLAARNAHNRKLAVGVAGGTSLIICDNTALHGNWFTVIRRHVGDVEKAVKQLVSGAAEHAMDAYLESVLFQENLRDNRCEPVRGYEVIGRARGTGCLTPKQTERAMTEWQVLNGKDSKHLFAEERNAFGLYQCFTESLKAGVSTRKLGQYTGLPELFQQAGLTE